MIAGGDEFAIKQEMNIFKYFLKKISPLQLAQHDDWNELAWATIVAAGKAGAESTRNMVATLGRAARLGERSLGHPDPGAMSACMIIAEFAQSFGGE